MSLDRRTLLLASLVFVAAPAVQAADPGSATLPLDRVIELHNKDNTTDTDPLPPMPAVYERFELHGRIAGDSLEGRAQIDVAVLGDRWVEVELLRLDEKMDITDLPHLDQANLVVRKGRLLFVSKKTGRHSFRVGLRVSGDVGKTHFTARLQPGAATLMRMRLEHSYTLIRVQDSRSRRVGDETLVSSQQGRLEVSWTVVEEAPRETAPEPVAQPIEPSVPRGDVTLVQTLDGRRIARYRYTLRMRDAQKLPIEIPEGQALERLYLDGRPVSFESNPSETGPARITVEVAPARGGEEQATLELVTRQENQPLTLAGRLRYRTPTLGWDIDQLYATLYLPTVFAYDWEGGSLSQSRPMPVPPASYTMLTPGHALGFEQTLVRGEADVEIHYSVNLDDNYYQ